MAFPKGFITAEYLTAVASVPNGIIEPEAVSLTNLTEFVVDLTPEKSMTTSKSCGDVLLSIGSRPLTDEVMSFAGVADRMMVIGDCDKVANVQRAMRSAWSAAVSI